jgi:alpha-tubulin suppressor-like RCC1 family protein
MVRTLSRAAALATAVVTLAACADDPVSATGARPALARSAADASADTDARVASVAITPDTARVVVGRARRLAAVVRDSAGKALEGQVVAWASSSADVATVDSAGVVTGVAIGSATITATSGGRTDSAVVTVHDASVYAVSVAPRPVTLVAGDTLTLAAAARDAQDGVVADAAVRWASADTTIAAVDSATGAVTARAAGVSLVTATSGAASDTMTVTVVPGVTGIRIVAALDTLEAYEVRGLGAQFTDSAGRVVTHGPTIARREVRWSSSDTAIARVDSVTGALTGVDRGTVTITATSGDLTATAKRVVVIRYRSLVTATEHACDIASGGIVWCWGRNANDGRLGMAKLGDTVTSNVPVRLPGSYQFTQLYAYGRATCGLTADGSAYCWGYNGWGMLARPTGTSQSTTPVLVSPTLRFRTLATGADHICGLATDDRAYCWGANSDGQFGTGKTGSSTTPVQAAGGMAFVAIAAGTGFTCGLTAAGEAWCFGYSGLGNLGDGTKISFGNTYSSTPVRVAGGHAFRSIHASNQYACGVTPAGEAYCWGNNANGQLGAPSVSATSTPVAVTGGLSFRSLSTGFGLACGVTTGSAVYCWGMNKDGQLGAVVPNGSTKPVRSAGTLLAAEVSAANVATGAGSFACAISADRLTTQCWGKNDKGQLGNGTTGVANQAGSPTPTTVVGQKPAPAEK